MEAVSNKGKAAMKVSYKKEAPESFVPPFCASVVETFSIDGVSVENGTGSLETAVENVLSEPLPVLRRLMGVRNAVVGRLGFVATDNDCDSLYGPFIVDYPVPMKMKASFDDPNFEFYAELILGSGRLDCHSAVKFKNSLGRVYFYTIYPVHLLVFQFILRKIAGNLIDDSSR